MLGDDLPVLDIPLPRPVTRLHQIELTSRCSLACSYCAHPTMPRAKVDMSREHFTAALDHVAFYVAQGTQRDLNLAGIGESTMVDDFLERLLYARQRLPTTPFLLATNGLHLTDEMAKVMKELHCYVWVSTHAPKKAIEAMRIAKRHKIFIDTSEHPYFEIDDWAGQVDLTEHVAKNPGIPLRQSYVPACTWLRDGWAMAMADGRVTACCIDGDGSGVIGHVNDALGSLKTKPYKLCPTCQKDIRIASYDQRQGKEFKLNVIA